MEVTTRLSQLHADGPRIAGIISQAIETETAELDASIQRREAYVLTAPRSGQPTVHWFTCKYVANTVEREIAWTERIDALVKLILRDPMGDLDTLLAEALRTRVGMMPNLLSEEELLEPEYAYRSCRTCKPPFQSREPANSSLRHLGVGVRPGTLGLQISRDRYAEIDNRSSLSPRVYSDDWCAKQQRLALMNYDLNMEFFEALDQQAFDNELTGIIEALPRLREVSDLNVLANQEGVYVMVLDRYRQAYIGVSSNMKTRIQAHWTRRMPFDRLIFGSPYSSVIAIDSFRHHDTTRVLAVTSDDPYELEAQLVDLVNPDFLLNRTSGGGDFGRLLDEAVGTTNLKQRDFGSGA